MRILLIANTLPPRDLSGVGEQVLQLAAGLTALGCEVEILGRKSADRDGAPGPKILFPLTIVPATLRALRRFRPDVVQVHESDGALAASAVLWAKEKEAHPLLAALLQVSYVEEKKAVRPLVAAGREIGWPGAVEKQFRLFKAPIQIFFGRWTARRADLVLAPSAATAAELARDYGARRVEVLPNATGGLAPSGPPERSPEVGEGYFLFVGRLRIRKGVEVLFEALRSLPEARFLIAGDGEHRAALEAKAGELGLAASGAVSFLGRCGAPRVAGLLAGAAALVVPSTYEGMPLVVLEAMAAGVPVVASRVSGIPEVVVDGETGWLVPAEDPAALAAALAAVRADPAEAKRRGEAGRKRVAERYRPEVVAGLWLEIVARRGHESKWSG
ncbi:MAG TPA: glycosyltransferase family 4 protein [Thermoanaerobaculia bacterium]|jgi:glycosyltransferase involved in cell wall biosynthesis|nr:glycosyltransferase family 4 protein [Thermoanaerobaculia bacterium]